MRRDDGLVCGVDQRSPGAPGARLEARCDVCPHVAALLGSAQTRARSQYVAVIVSQTLVNPEQIVLHRDVEVRRPQIGGAAKFAVPGMHVLVRKQSTTA